MRRASDVSTKSVALGPAFLATSTPKPGGCHFPISDTGCWYGCGNAGCVFRPFFTTKGSRGTGLDWRRYRIVNQARGLSGLEQPGDGTSFQVYLPCIDELLPTKPPTWHRAGPQSFVAARLYCWSRMGMACDSPAIRSNRLASSTAGPHGRRP